MALLNGELDVVGVVVAAPDRDQVFAASGDEKLPGAQESQVTGAQERAAAGVRQVGRERLFGLLGPCPVPPGNAGPDDPDLTDFVRPALPSGLRIDDDDPLTALDAAATHQRQSRRMLRSGVEHAVLL